MTDSNSSSSNANTPQQQTDSTVSEQSLCEFESFEYHSDDNVYRVLYDHDDASPSSAVVNAIAAASDADPLDIEPLYSTIDPEALDTVVTTRSNSEGDLHVTFEFQNYEVTVSSYGSLKIRPLQPSKSSPVASD